MNIPLLRCQNVGKSFQRGHENIEVLRNVEFYICSGETVLLFGRSGQGKSVLLSLLSGLDHPSSGDIYFDGVWLNSCSPKQLEKIRRTEIGIIFQNLNLLPSWTALENVEAALEGIISSPKLKRSQAQTLLDTMGLADRMNHLPGQLSMGEQQRVAIARTLIRRPRLILADEPTGDLDTVTAKQTLHLLLAYVRETNATLFVTTHGIFPEIGLNRRLILDHGTISQPIHYSAETYRKIAPRAIPVPTSAAKL